MTVGIFGAGRKGYVIREVEIDLVEMDALNFDMVAIPTDEESRTWLLQVEMPVQELRKLEKACSPGSRLSKFEVDSCSSVQLFASPLGADHVIRLKPDQFVKVIVGLGRTDGRDEPFRIVISGHVRSEVSW